MSVNGLQLPRSQKTRPFLIALKIGVLICLGIAAALCYLLFGSMNASVNLTPTAQPVTPPKLSEAVRRDRMVRISLLNHPVAVLAGDYHRLGNLKNVKPATESLENCSTPHLTGSVPSTHSDFEESSFAYLLTLEAGSTATTCSLNQVVASYGEPNQSEVIAGTPGAPKEMLLFYDTGSTASRLFNDTSFSNTVLPVKLADLPRTNCVGTGTTVSIVAHQDDDLLFINPAIKEALAEGNCVRTIYLTAGDAGNGQMYWQSRERGTQAAYNDMVGNDKAWVYRTLELGDHQYATVANPSGNKKLSLIFLRLPDGQPSGTGNRATGFESLGRLKSGKISRLHSVDGRSTMTANNLVDGLAAILGAYQPSQILTQTPYQVGTKFSDHSDHIMTGQFVRQAKDLYVKQHKPVSIKYYLGYPIRSKPKNLSPKQVSDKEAPFFKYAQYDNGVCKNGIACRDTSYIFYLQREYQTADH